MKMESKVSLNVVKNWQSLCHDIVFADIAPSLLQNYIISVDEYQNITNQPETARTESFLLLLLKKNENIIKKFGKLLEKNYNWLAEKLREGCTEDIKMEGRDEIDANPFVPMESCRTFENDITIEDEKDTCMECKNLNSNNMEHLNNKINNNKEGKIERRRRRITKSRIKNKLKPKVQNTEAPVFPPAEVVKPELNEEVTDEVITIVKNSWLLAKSWTTVAHSLGLTDRVHDIRVKAILFGEDWNMCVVHLLKTWLEMFPQTATLSKLIEILRRENFNKVADQLTEILHRKKTTDNPIAQ